MIITKPDALLGIVVVDATGAALGEVADVYFDNDTGTPKWVAIKSEVFGGHVSLLPLVHVTQDGAKLRTPYAQNQVKDGPHYDPDQELSVEDEADLFRYYHVAPVRAHGQTETATQPDVASAASPAKKTVTGRETVDAEIRKERIVQESLSAVDRGRQ